jgi:hypothetical protein
LTGEADGLGAGFRQEGRPKAGVKIPTVEQRAFRKQLARSYDSRNML